MNIPEPLSWRHCFAQAKQQGYWQKLHDFLAAEQQAGHTIYPPPAQRYLALETVAPEAVKVVILGQDPYANPGQAHGLAFSVPDKVKSPPSLVNIYKEIARDLQCTPRRSGNLMVWAQQGVLLLNSILSVRAGQPGSHRNRGWEQFTDSIICYLATQYRHIVFMLWGNEARAKQNFIHNAHHCVLTSAHPSPLAAYRGFIGNGHFSKANAYLQQQGNKIHW